LASVIICCNFCVLLIFPNIARICPKEGEK
jgi:hypothetical protein